MRARTASSAQAAEAHPPLTLPHLQPARRPVQICAARIPNWRLRPSRQRRLNTLRLQRATLHMARIVGIGALDGQTLRPDASAQGLATLCSAPVMAAWRVAAASSWLIRFFFSFKSTANRLNIACSAALACRQPTVPFRFHSAVCGADQRRPTAAKRRRPKVAPRNDGRLGDHSLCGR